MFQARHYEVLARLIGRYLDNGEGIDFIAALVTVLSEDNPRFDFDRFVEAISKERAVA